MNDRECLHKLAFLLVALLFLGSCTDSTGPTLDDPRLFLTASAGGEHTCGITLEGKLLCWGRNSSGQLGDGSNLNRNLPTEVMTSEPFESVSAGDSHTCGLTREGEAYCWGDNERGQLGLGSEDSERLQPERVATEARFTSISAGYQHTCAVDTDGNGYCWGSNYLGRLGAEATEDCGGWGECSRNPVQVSGGLRWNRISAGDSHTCGLAKGGQAFCWGSNEYGQLGATTTETFPVGPIDWPIPISTTPVVVSGGLSWQELSVGGWHTCGRADDDRIYCWGWNEYGQLGATTTETCETRHDPKPCSTSGLPVSGGMSWQALDGGYRRTCAISDEGATYCWGGADLGDGTGQHSPVPAQVAISARFAFVTTGGTHTCGMGQEGVLYCWGANRYGQLGDGTNTVKWPTPVPVKGW